MAALGQLFAFLLGGLADFLVKYFGKRIAVSISFVTIMSSLMFGVFAFVSQAFVFTALSFPESSYLAIGFWLGVPPSAPACITLILTTDAMLAAYGINMQVVKTMASAS